MTLSDMKGYVSKEVFNGTWEKPNYTQGYEQTWNNKKNKGVWDQDVSLLSGTFCYPAVKGAFMSREDQWQIIPYENVLVTN